jgi:hypothetical protein
MDFPFIPPHREWGQMNLRAEYETFAKIPSIVTRTMMMRMKALVVVKSIYAQFLLSSLMGFC